MPKTPPSSKPSARRDLKSAILEALAKAGAGCSISPSEVAQALDANDAAWRRYLNPIRTEATHLARAGQIEILRHGKPIDPHESFKGVIRLRLPETADQSGA